MPETLLNTREVAAYLQINEKQVYRLIRKKVLPATRITGKWLFPQSLVEAWVRQNAQSKTRPASLTERLGLDRGLLVAGSNDPMLDALLELYRRQQAGHLVYTANLGSLGGLEALGQGKAHIALAHLRDGKTGEYNLPFLGRYVPLDAVVAVTLWHRKVGFVQRLDSPRVCSFSDLKRRKLRLVNRQQGSGIRLLVDQGLQAAGVSPAQIQGYDTEVWTHWEVGVRILCCQADVGVATESVARLLGLAFQEIVEERFDLLVLKDHYFTKPVQALLAAAASEDLKGRALALGGYDLRSTGRVVFPT